MKKIKGRAYIIGKRWYSMTETSCHKTTVFVNGNRYISQIVYGHGDHYKRTGYNLLVQNGYEVSGDYWKLENAVYEVSDVSRKCEL